MRTFAIATMIAVVGATSFSIPSYAATASRGESSNGGNGRSGASRGEYFDGVTHYRKRPWKKVVSGAYCVNGRVPRYDDYGNLYYERIRHCDDRVDIEVR
ncbi:hypothetical protein [Ensifer soli]|uniref:hypothetical protein n=1 Tax=Ciceribacter sp. sgz301302 TaxID=3342379 RepID=UPI0035BA8257